MSEPAAPPHHSEIKDRQRAAWSAGDYSVAAAKIAPGGRSLVDALAIGPRDRVLDVACGTGNVTIGAAEAGARVTGLDLTPKLLEIARTRAADAGLEIEWVEGDAEELPFKDASFEVVTSAFGVMFVPRHEVAASELARVLGPGGRLGLASWTPEGSIGQAFAKMAELGPPPAPGPPPVAWGSESHVSELLGGRFELSFERATVRIEFDSVAAAVAFNETKFGPVVVALAALADDERQAMHEMIVADWTEKEEEDGKVVDDAEYLRVIGTRI